MFFHHSIADNKLHYCMCSVVIIIYYFFSKITVWIIAHYAHLPLSFALTTNQPITLMILSTNYLISISPWMACAAMKLIVSLSAHNLKYVYQEKDDAQNKNMQCYSNIPTPNSYTELNILSMSCL